MDITNPVIEELEKIQRDVDVLLEQLNQAYNKYFAGAEKAPPVQQRDRLEKLVARSRALQMQCQNNVVKFKNANMLSKYTTYASMWDKRMSERERTHG